MLQVIKVGGPTLASVLLRLRCLLESLSIFQMQVAVPELQAEAQESAFLKATRGSDAIGP